MKTNEASKKLGWREEILGLPLLAFICPATLLGMSAGVPTNPRKVPFFCRNPKGLRLIHTANSSAEADMIRNVLTQCELHPEFVPSVLTGVFGITGSNEVYVPESEEAVALEIVAELQAEPAPEPAV